MASTISTAPHAVRPTTRTAPPSDPDAIRRAELSAFLRSRRERISPAQAGMPLGGRRRTPGLRREEVAQLAGVGVTWYTWLEQGRDIKVSDQVLESIARTLQLDRDEHAHLFTLAGSADLPAAADFTPVPEPLLSMLQRLAPYPACVQTSKYDLLAFNSGYSRLIVNMDEIAPEDRNCMWLAFTHPAWRKNMVGWEEGVARMVAQFRGQMAEHVAEPAWKAFLRRMKAASPEFTALWDQHEVSAVQAKAKKIRNPWVGMLRFDPVSTWLNPRPGTRLLVYVPSDAETHRRLDTLATMIEEGQCG